MGWDTCHYIRLLRAPGTTEGKHSVSIIYAVKLDIFRTGLLPWQGTEDKEIIMILYSMTLHLFSQLIDRDMPAGFPHLNIL